MQLQDWLLGLGVEVDPESVQYRTLAREFLKARLRAMEGQKKRDLGRVVDTSEGLTVDELSSSLRPDSPSPEVKPRKGNSRGLRDVVDYWKSTGPKADRTVAIAW